MTDALAPIISAVLLEEVLFHMKNLQETFLSSQKPRRLGLLQQSELSSCHTTRVFMLGIPVYYCLTDKSSAMYSTYKKQQQVDQRLHEISLTEKLTGDQSFTYSPVHKDTLQTLGTGNNSMFQGVSQPRNGQTEKEGEKEGAINMLFSSQQEEGGEQNKTSTYTPPNPELRHCVRSSGT